MSEQTKSSVDKLAAERTGLAGDRTVLAADRTVMAADRTLLAWTRTSLALISFGFTIYKLLQYDVQRTAEMAIKADGPRRLGIAMISLGVIFLLLASVQFRGEMKHLRPSIQLAHWRLPFVMAILLALLGLLALVNVIWQVGPF